MGKGQVTKEGKRCGRPEYCSTTDWSRVELLATGVVRYTSVRMAPEGGIGAEPLSTDAAGVSSAQFKPAASKGDSGERSEERL